MNIREQTDISPRMQHAVNMICLNFVLAGWVVALSQEKQMPIGQAIDLYKVRTGDKRATSTLYQVANEYIRIMAENQK